MTDLARYGACTLAEPGPAQTGHGCTTCGDVAVPVRVVALQPGGTALCEDRAGARAEVATAFTPDAAPGDVLLVHAGVALARVQPEPLP